MAFKQSKHIFQGMSRDLSEDKQKGIYYIDAHNIRITAREDETLLSVTNEKGNKDLHIEGLGKYVGHAVLNNYLVLFTITDDNTSIIWRIDFTSPHRPITTKLYEGNLGFSTAHPIETLVDYETEDIQKVYWTDGNNQPRMINIVSNSIKPSIDTQFDFIPEVFPNGHDDLNIKVAKLINSSGTFKSGTIQYFVSYYNKFGQESNIVWQSPLLYISPEDRGGNVSETVGNAFQLDITGAANTFDFIRIYSVQHTSEDTDLIGRRIIDLSIPSTPSETITFIDNGILGESLNPSELYYKGGVPTAIGTMTTKDQTLFLGNIKLQNNQKISEDIKNELKSLDIEFELLPAYKAEEVDNKYYDYYNQLNENSYPELITENTGTQLHPYTLTHNITTYKYLETYRFGVQFQDIYGRWSEPVFIKDIQNRVAPEVRDVTVRPRPFLVTIPYVFLPTARITSAIPSTITNYLETNNYVKIRPIIVLPNESERECIAQGVLCPTVYNLGDRKTNSPYAQPSWFFRPYEGTSSGIGMGLPYKHNAIIQGKTSEMAEIEKSPEIQIPPTVGATYYDSSHPDWGLPGIGDTIYANQDINDKNFFIDQSIITLNSPDIEFNNIVLSSDYGFRIVGIIDVTGFSGSTYIQASAPNTFYRTEDFSLTDIGHGQPEAKKIAEGYLPTYVRQANISATGWSIMGKGGFWFDTPYTEWLTIDRVGSNAFTKYVYPSGLRYSFTTFPWQSSGSLNNTNSRSSLKIGDDTWTIPSNTADLQYKVLANLRYSAHTKYLTEDISNLTYDISDAQIIDSQLSNTTQLNGSSGKRTYYSDIDKVLGVPDNTVEQMLSQITETYYDIYIDPVFKKIYDWDIIVTAHKNSGSPAYPNFDSEGSSMVLRQDMALSFYSGGGLLVPNVSSLFDSHITDIIKNNARLSVKATATHITYKSMKHAVISLGDYSTHTYTVLPRIKFRNGSNERIVNNLSNTKWTYGIGNYNETTQLYDQAGSRYVWDNLGLYNNTAAQKSITIVDSDWYDKGVLLIGELYRKEIPNKFGGTSDDAIQQNVWIPAGESINIGDVIRWTEGDTYFQRYDCLKTYPYSNESTNNIVEILSFMCETRVNIAGRYDKNRGLLDNTFITNENFNLINKGYTQRNNFFSYRTLDSKFGLKQFKTQLTWTKVKSAGATIDNWTNVTLQNTLDLDGDKGELISLNRYNNEIIAFQPKGISQIIYNPNVQINTTSGLPIEIANSGRVQGKRYLYEGIGCQNKWSICDEVYGSLYFIDNYAKSIFRISSEGLVSLTDNKGLREWMQDNNTLNTWRPYLDSNLDRKAFRTFYDKGFKDVYFVNGNTCLVYSALLDQFISFMDYQSTDAMFNIGDNFYAAYETNLYQQFAGDYNNIYGQDRDYYLTFIDNQIPEMNKIYTNLEYRSDTYIDDKLIHDETFDTIRVYNEYQDTGEHSVKANLDKPYLSDLQKKFRVWRIQIPRDKDNPLNRINNTWAKFTLKKYKTDKEKTVLHDAMIGYYI